MDSAATSIAPIASSDAPASAAAAAPPARIRKPATKKSHKSEEGETLLPASRVTRIIKADKDIAMCSKEAVFLISVAAERFVQKLTEAAYTTSRMEKRKGIQYKDLSTAIQRDQSFFYLSEVIPPPIPLKEATKARKKKFADEAGLIDEEATQAAAAQVPSTASTSQAQPTQPTQPGSASTSPQRAPGSSALSLNALLNAEDTPGVEPPSSSVQASGQQDVQMQDS